MEDGLRFACQRGCTNCCERQGFVYLTEEDVRKAARYLGMSLAAFERRYIYRTAHMIRLRKPRGSQCHFLGPAGCSIHPAKPTQCRLFPFWPELVENRESWNIEARFCPGIGMGPLIQIGTAVETADEMRRAYPAMYFDRKL
jgi:Fe-S-cluster containining protein